MRRGNTIKLQILKELLAGKRLSSIDMRYSNTNQYFNQLKRMGIELIEKWEDNSNNSGQHKERWLNPTPSNIKKAKNLYKILRG